MRHPALDRVLRRDRTVVVFAIAALTALAWAYVSWLAADMRMGGMDMRGWRMIPAGGGQMVPAGQRWQIAEFGLVFAMWAVMMVGMMTPSATPMILLYARIGRETAAQASALPGVAWFVTGYLLVWAGFSFVATLAHWAFERALLLTPMMAAASHKAGAAILIGAGVYEWTPLKRACLQQCQAPWVFIQRHGGFRRTAGGSLAFGARHGLYCLGCCWALMAVLFVGGVMNMLWIAGLTILVLLEKVIPGGRLVPHTIGAGLVLAGVWMMAAG